MALPILKDEDLDASPLANKRVAVVGYGNQGEAHALNLRDSGVEIIVGARRGSASEARAASAGFQVRTAGDAAAGADLVMVLAPDEKQAALYEAELAPQLTHAPALAFGHGFAIHFGTVRPAPTIPVILVAPVGPGKLLRRRYQSGSGIPAVIAVHQDPRGDAKALARAYAKALGCGRAGVIESTFKDECETDLFGEQNVIVGGVSALITAGYEVLVEAGYPEELAYFECAHQMKLLVDLIHERGIAGMREAISNTAKYGDLTRGPRVIDAATKARMKDALEEIRSGAFAKEWIAEYRAGAPDLARRLTAASAHPMETVGRRLRTIALDPDTNQ